MEISKSTSARRPSKNQRDAGPSKSPSVEKSKAKKAKATSDAATSDATNTKEQTMTQTGSTISIHVDQLSIWANNARNVGNESPEQMSIETLRESIRDNGLLQPPVVREHDGRFQVIAGQRRTLAMQMLVKEGLDGTIEVRNVGQVDDATASVISLIENLEREDMRPSQKAVRVCELLSVHGMNVSQAAKALSMPETTVRRVARIGTLDAKTLDMLDREEINQGQAEALSEVVSSNRKAMLKWFKEGVSVEDARSLMASRNNRFDLKDALFSQSEYEAAAPGKIDEDLFGNVTAKDGATYVRLQEEKLRQAIEDGQHGSYEQMHVHVSSELPGELNLEEHPEGTVLVGLVQPLGGRVHVVRARPKPESSENAAELYTRTQREEALASLTNIVAREALKLSSDSANSARHLINALLYQQLEGGPRCFVISRQSSALGLEELGTGHPARGQWGDLIEASRQPVDLSNKLASLYEGTPETDQMIIEAAGIHRVTLRPERLRALGIDAVMALVPGLVRGSMDEIIAQAEDQTVTLRSVTLPRGKETTEALRTRITRAGLDSHPDYAGLMNLSEADMIDQWTPAREDALRQLELQSQLGEQHSEEQIVSAYERLSASSERTADISEFLAAVESDQMSAASEALRRIER